MEKNIAKTLPLIFIAVVGILIIYSSNLALKKQKENELTLQKLLKIEQTKKETEEKIQEKVYLMGKFDPSQREDFILIPEQYTIDQKSQNKMYLKKETLNAFLKMQIAASKEKIDLKIASATRNFDYQKNIWNRKWTGYTLVEGKNLLKSIPDGLARFKKILEYSSVPGTSRHHWGSDLDINDANTEYFKKESGKKVYDWLVENAWEFGFCQPYNPKGTSRQTGYNEEKWHWSYLPLAKNFTEEYKNLIRNEDINGFLGEEYVPRQDLINDYVLEINSDCL